MEVLRSTNFIFNGLANFRGEINMKRNHDKEQNEAFAILETFQNGNRIDAYDALLKKNKKRIILLISYMLERKELEDFLGYIDIILEDD